MIDILQKLFGGEGRIKLLRLFLFNPRISFSIAEAAQRSRVPDREARQEIKMFSDIGLVKRARSAHASSSKEVRYQLDETFTYLAALQSLLLNSPDRGRDLFTRLRRTGSIKLFVVAGVLVGEWDGRLDMLVVGDRVNDRKLRENIRNFESEIGKELRYALLSTNDFFYRLNMNDHLVRDVFDYQHRIVEDKLNIGLK